MDTIATALLILAAIIMIYTGAWVRELYLCHKRRQKSRMSRPVEFTTYDSKGEIKHLGHELRALTWGRRPKSDYFK
jgi:heme A synthase